MDIKKLSFCHFQTEINILSKKRLRFFFSPSAAQVGTEEGTEPTAGKKYLTLKMLDLRKNVRVLQRLFRF